MRRFLPYLTLVVLFVGMALCQTTDQTTKIAVDGQRITSLESQVSHFQQLNDTVIAMKATVDSDHQLIWTLLIATVLNVLHSILGKSKVTDVIEKKARGASAGN